MPDDTTLIAPSDSLENGRKKYSSKTSAVFVLHKDTVVLNFFMKTVEDQNAPGYQTVISQLHYLSVPGGFSGEILYFTLGRQFINGYLWKGGAITKSVSLSTVVVPPSPQAQSYKGKLKADNMEPINCVTTVYEIMQVTTVTYGNNPPVTTVEPSGQTFSETTCDWIDTGGDTGSGSGGVSGGTGTTPSPSPCSPASNPVESSVKSGRLVINYVPVAGGGSGSGGGTGGSTPCTTTTTTTPTGITINTDTLGRNFPCAIQILQKLLSLKSYNDFVEPFETNQKPDLIWSDKDLTWNPTNGASMLGQTQVDPNSRIGLGSLITLNNKMLQNSSTLLIEAAFIHETLHAYINYDVAIANANGTPNFKFNGSWLNELDVFIDQNGLPSNYRDHYEMMTDYFSQAISILAAVDNNAHTTQQYVMAMLYGLSTTDPNSTSDEVTRLTQEYNNLMSSYGIRSTQLNSFWITQLIANSSDKLSTNCAQ
jgi:hypothetical protein